MEIKSGKKVKSLEDFFKATTSTLKGYLFVSIGHLFENLESGKRNYCFGKKCRESLEFWIQKICTNPVIRLSLKELTCMIRLHSMHFICAKHA